MTHVTLDEALQVIADADPNMRHLRTGHTASAGIRWTNAAAVRHAVTAHPGITTTPGGQRELTITAADGSIRALTTPRSKDGCTLLANAIIDLQASGHIHPNDDGGITVTPTRPTHLEQPTWTDIVTAARAAQTHIAFGDPATTNHPEAEILAALLTDLTPSGADGGLSWDELTRVIAQLVKDATPLTVARALAADQAHTDAPPRRTRNPRTARPPGIATHAH
jgi:hypothetical protein